MITNTSHYLRLEQNPTADYGIRVSIGHYHKGREHGFHRVYHPGFASQRRLDSLVGYGDTLVTVCQGEILICKSFTK